MAKQTTDQTNDKVADTKPAVVKEPSTTFDERTSAEAPWAEYQRERVAEEQKEKDAVRDNAPTLSED